MSRALNKTEIRWSTYEKEGYAIIEALRKFRQTLGDKHCLIRTDHKNLTFRDSGSPRVLRWKMDMMEYNFDIPSETEFPLHGKVVSKRGGDLRPPNGGDVATQPPDLGTADPAGVDLAGAAAILREQHGQINYASD